jgi:hypothetical protein
MTCRCDKPWARPATVALLVGGGLLTAACADEDSRSVGDDLDEGIALRLGRVHVVLEPSLDSADVVEPDSPPALEVSARFAYFRGLDEDFVRARIDMPMFAGDVLQPGQCVPSHQLDTTEASGEVDGEIRELVLVDAGNLTVEIGDARFDVPVSLVPDLLPYMSGVEYLYETDVMPVVLAVDTPTPVRVSAEGSQTDELPPFAVRGQVPIRLDLQPMDTDMRELDEDVLAIQWRSTSDPSEAVVVRLSSFVGSEPAGNEVTCVFADDGQAHLDLERVRGLGLGASGDILQLSASRMHRTTFDAGDLVGGEIVVEVRSRLALRLP